MTTAIEVEGVSKRFRSHSEPARTLKDRLLTLGRSTVDTFDALTDVSFSVGVGETFGILGHNGSGKSTLLKCIAGTLTPTDGAVRVRGRLSALLELGAGFHPDLTGRENVYLNGSILGFSRARIDEIFDDIVAFSGLGTFIESQVKYYSSGMYARLGFAVAVNLDPDVLLIDEVLAVGDEAFQAKCVDRITQFQRDGRTMCLVTHSPDMVRSLCDRAMVLDGGRIRYIGDVNEAVTAYRHALAGIGATDDANPGQPVIDARLDRNAIAIVDSWVEQRHPGTTTHRPGDKVVIHARFRAPIGHTVRVRLMLAGQDGAPLVNVTGSDITGNDVGPTQEMNAVRFVIEDFPFTDGQYLVSLALDSPDGSVTYDRQDDHLSFDVHSNAPVLSRVVMRFGFESTLGASTPVG
ncbi:MAG: polysaccharide ABC transporter ATP-binding protein [Actinomycetota bacterium]